MTAMIKLTTRSNNLLPLFGKYLQGSSRVLNLGSGDGLLSEALRNRKPDEGQPVKVIDIDLTNRSKTAQRPILYDGREIPFSDKFFDATLGLYVLHHACDPDRLILEMKRVTSGYIILFEDLAETPWDAFVCFCQGIRQSEWDFERAKLSLKTQEQWIEACSRHGLELVDRIRLPRFSPLTGRTYPVARAMMVFKARIELDAQVSQWEDEGDREPVSSIRPSRAPEMQLRVVRCARPVSLSNRESAPRWRGTSGTTWAASATPTERGISSM